jgi:hypothetical protein
MSFLTNSFGQRFEKLIQRWNSQLARDFRQYANLRAQPEISSELSEIARYGEPYWLLIPEWLATAYRQKDGRRSLDRRFLKDVLWGQYCLFLAIKIHDDMFDKHVDQPSLVWAGDEFLQEAQGAFARHFERSSRFWEFYARAIRTTIRAVVENDWIQSQRRPSYTKLFRLHAGMYSVCKIAAYAVCLRSSKVHDVGRLSVFMDQMAIVGQTIDDFGDIGEDLNRGRRNSVAAFLLRSEAPSRREDSQRIARSLLFTDATQRLFRILQRRLGRAEESIRYLDMPAAARYLSYYKDSIRRLEHRMHTQRVRQLFAAETD